VKQPWIPADPYPHFFWSAESSFSPSQMRLKGGEKHEQDIMVSFFAPVLKYHSAIK